MTFHCMRSVCGVWGIIGTVLARRFMIWTFTQFSRTPSTFMHFHIFFTQSKLCRNLFYINVFLCLNAHCWSLIEFLPKESDTDWLIHFLKSLNIGCIFGDLKKVAWQKWPRPEMARGNFWYFVTNYLYFDLVYVPYIAFLCKVACRILWFKIFSNLFKMAGKNYKKLKFY